MKSGGKKETTEGTEQLNTWRKGKLQVLGNVRDGHHQTSEYEEKNKKIIPERNKKTSGNQTLQQKSH